VSSSFSTLEVLLFSEQPLDEPVHLLSADEGYMGVATENLLLAAALADGTTTIRNAAREPEVSDLVDCLTAMGASISGIGTGTLSCVGIMVVQTTGQGKNPDHGGCPF
jgi:hypothetical protein